MLKQKQRYKTPRYGQNMNFKYAGSPQEVRRKGNENNKLPISAGAEVTNREIEWKNTAFHHVSCQTGLS